MREAALYALRPSQTSRFRSEIFWMLPSATMPLPCATYCSVDHFCAFLTLTLRRIDRALGVGAGAAHRLYLLDRRPLAQPGEEGGGAEELTVLGATGNVYEVCVLWCGGETWAGRSPAPAPTRHPVAS